MPSLLFALRPSCVAQVPKDLAWQALSSGVKDQNATTRAIALRSLALVSGDDAAVALVLGSLKDPVPAVRMAAAASLGKMNATSSIPALKDAAHDEDVGVILAATSSLRSLGDPSAFLVYYAVLTGERKSGEGLVAAQKKTLSDPKKLAQLGFEQGIGFIPFAGLGYGAVKAITKDDESPIRAAAAVALATDPDPKSGKALTNAVQDKSWLVRTAALDAIARRGDPALIPEIVPAMNDGRREVKYAAAAAVYHLSVMRRK
ncbi:MAG: HEAT repeat domain-containing protein [Terracidiphilus sp.]